MKTTKSIIVILFLLLTAQIASAYYCPSTGRWLSRDPISEPGFQIQKMAAQIPAGISSRWLIRDPSKEDISTLVPKRSLSRDLKKLDKAMDWNINIYEFNRNAPSDYFDYLGLNPVLEIDPNCDNGEDKPKYIQQQYDAAMNMLAEADSSSAFSTSEKNAIKCLQDSNKNIHIKCNDCILCLGSGNDEADQGGGNKIVLCPGVFMPKPNHTCWQVALLVEMMKKTGCLPAGRAEENMKYDLARTLCPK